MHSKTLRTLTCMTWSNSSELIPSNGFGFSDANKAALLTNPLIWPKLSRVVVTRRAIAAGSATSAVLPIASPPAPMIASISEWQASAINRE